MAKKKSAKRLRVDFLMYKRDRDVQMYGNLGLFDRAIAEKTGLTLSQVRYRMMKSNSSLARREYRNGRGGVLRQVLRAVTDIGKLNKKIFKSAK